MINYHRVSENFIVAVYVSVEMTQLKQMKENIKESDISVLYQLPGRDFCLCVCVSTGLVQTVP